MFCTQAPSRGKTLRPVLQHDHADPSTSLEESGGSAVHHGGVEEPSQESRQLQVRVGGSNVVLLSHVPHLAVSPQVITWLAFIQHTNRTVAHIQRNILKQAWRN
jgi:hypothetical protein